MANQSNRRPTGRGSSPPPGTDVAVIEAGGISKFIAAYEGNLTRVMPKHVAADAFMGLAVARVVQDPKLRQAAEVNPRSLILALRECAMLGHTPSKGTYALVPYRNNDPKKGPPLTVVGIEEYRGVIERMYRAGGVSAVTAVAVRKGDVFAPGRTRTAPPLHEYDPFEGAGARGPLRGVYAYAVLFGGTTSHVVYLGPEEIAKHREVSRSGEAFWGPKWPGEGEWTEAMWLKTGLHGLERWVPTSAEYRWQLDASAAAAGATGRWQGLAEAASPGPVLDGDDIQDAELVDDTPAGPAEAAVEPDGGDPWNGIEVAQPGGGER